jgi:hypothetical protein
MQSTEAPSRAACSARSPASRTAARDGLNRRLADRPFGKAVSFRMSRSRIPEVLALGGQGVTRIFNAAGRQPDFGFGRFRAGTVRNRRSRTCGDRVAETAFYVTGSILTRQAQTFPIRELYATCVAGLFWQPVAARREVGRSNERHSSCNSKTGNDFPHALLHRG